MSKCRPTLARPCMKPPAPAAVHGTGGPLLFSLRIRASGWTNGADSARESLSEHLLGLLSALAALALRAPEELGEIVVALTLGVLDIGLEP
jgi:hypothetical protein